jgi:hypothetical protein
MHECLLYSFPRQPLSTNRIFLSVFLGHLIYTPQYPSSQWGETLCLLFKSKKDLNPISKPKNPPLLHFMICIFRVPPHPRPLILGMPLPWGFIRNQIICICLYFHTLCSLAPLHIQVAIFFPSPILIFNSNFIYFGVVIPALQDVSFSYISNTNLRGLWGRYLLRCCREEGLKRSDDGRATTWHRYVWQTSILPGLSKDRYGFSPRMNCYTTTERTT